MNDLSSLADVPLTVQAVLGSTTIRVKDLLKLGRNAILELDTRVGEPNSIQVNGRVIAKGELQIVEDRLAISLIEIVKGDNNGG